MNKHKNPLLPIFGPNGPTLLQHTTEQSGHRFSSVHKWFRMKTDPSQTISLPGAASRCWVLIAYLFLLFLTKEICIFVGPILNSATYEAIRQLPFYFLYHFTSLFYMQDWILPSPYVAFSDLFYEVGHKIQILFQCLFWKKSICGKLCQAKNFRHFSCVQQLALLLANSSVVLAVHNGFSL